MRGAVNGPGAGSGGVRRQEELKTRLNDACNARGPYAKTASGIPGQNDVPI
ncbi:hypothetical protein B0G76_6465 [Paraburkholderia sp. BL23I1N1]|nr:hypothetical protein B0G76_6465 [Paraburkholderia sp. BL23I1N1]